MYRTFRHCVANPLVRISTATMLIALVRERPAAVVYVCWRLAATPSSCGCQSGYFHAVRSPKPPVVEVAVQLIGSRTSSAAPWYSAATSHHHDVVSGSREGRARPSQIRQLHGLCPSGGEALLTHCDNHGEPAAGSRARLQSGYAEVSQTPPTPEDASQGLTPFASGPSLESLGAAFVGCVRPVSGLSCTTAGEPCVPDPSRRSLYPALMSTQLLQHGVGRTLSGSIGVG
jgi:hypothetical protein